MNKLYLFCIGGTGVRVLRSLTMLLMAGTDCGVETIVPIVIDRDTSNGDFTRTKGLIENYIAVHKIARTNGNNKFFRTNLRLLNNNLYLQLFDNTLVFKDYIGHNTMSLENKALIEILFSKDVLNLNMSEGFQGNPNIGSIVLNQFENSNVFRDFAEDFQDGDMIFIISSIFGGTGASGFPLLRRILHTTNVRDAHGNLLPNWGLINKAKIGAISVLPYFKVSIPNEQVLVNSDTFIDKTKAALTYYKTEDKKIDVLYYIGDKLSSSYDFHTGGDAQRNNAHFVELAAALAILDFVNPNKFQINFHRDENNNIEKTTYKEFGVNNLNSVLTFSDLADETKRLLINPLSRFLLFAKYMGYRAIKKDIHGREASEIQYDDGSDIFKKEFKYQPYARNKFDGDFRQKEVIRKLESGMYCFLEWLLEMENQNRKFSPFNLYTSDTDFIKGDLKIIRHNKFPYKSWAKVDNELNRLIHKVDKAMENESRFLELFYSMTENIINYKS